MKILFLAPSIIPSRTANSIQVIQQCRGFVELGHEVILFAGTKNKSVNKKEIENYYGADCHNIEFNLLRCRVSRGVVILLALYQFLHVMRHKSKFNLIITRNVYLSTLLSLFKQKHVYEEHTIFSGLKSKVQENALYSPYAGIILISKALKNLLEAKFSKSLKNGLVLHDCAGTTYKQEKPKDTNIYLDPKVFNICYFGHLYPGRGIEIIAQLSKFFEKFSFHIIGGNDTDINNCKTNFSHKNLHFHGHKPHLYCQHIMSEADILLMPYQNSVMVDHRGTDTSKWMSPLKMFEYMSSGTPILASNLPVLREVLTHEANCLLAEPDQISEWITNLDRLANDTILSCRISRNARAEILSTYNWKVRCNEIICKFG